MWWVSYDVNLCEVDEISYSIHFQTIYQREKENSLLHHYFVYPVTL